MGWAIIVVTTTVAILIMFLGVWKTLFNSLSKTVPKDTEFV